MSEPTEYSRVLDFFTKAARCACWFLIGFSILMLIVESLGFETAGPRVYYLASAAFYKAIMLDWALRPDGPCCCCKGEGEKP